MKVQTEALATVQDEPTPTGVVGRGTLSEVRRHDPDPRRAHLVVSDEDCCGSAEVERVQPVWRPLPRARVRLSNGFGERITAEIMTRVQPSTREFGVRIFAWQTAGPWHWLPLASRGLTWWPVVEDV